MVQDQATDNASKTDDGHGCRDGNPQHGGQASFGDVEAAGPPHRSAIGTRRPRGAWCPRNTQDQVGQAHEHTAGNVVEHGHGGCIGCLAAGSSDIEEEVDDVAVGNHIRLAFASELASFPDPFFVVVKFQILQAEAFGTDKTAFEVGVDDAGGLGSGGSNRNGPCPDFFFSGGEVTLEAQQGVGRSRDLVKSRFIHAKISEHLRLGLVVELRKFAFNFRANFDHPSAGVVGVIAKRITAGSESSARPDSSTLAMKITRLAVIKP